MKQISTGAGLVALSVGMVTTAFIATHRSGSEAFAQGSGLERRIVSQGVYGHGSHWAYRVWSDNVTECKYLGDTGHVRDPATGRDMNTIIDASGWPPGLWQVVDTGAPAFVPADIDRTGHVDAADVAQVLLEFNSSIDPTTPPPIDCNINAPR